MKKQTANPVHIRFNAIIVCLTIATGLVLATMAPANAATSARNFFSPGYLGQPVAFCLETDRTCGKPAATIWCQHNGYDEALSFARRRLDQGAEIRFADTGNVSSSTENLTFSQIRCLKGE